ncbi:MAG: thiamine-phosphate diphosphorylase [Deltaproteobacteria bacterium RBG_16_66_15]|nr:MAG: thiamine-phosphate diphosphorylase [Deltaproteobacteria bacterium RBG_16_66_15]
MSESVGVGFGLYLITDRRQVRSGDLLAAVERALAAGVRAVQLREKDLSGRELYALAVAMRRLASRYGAKLLINDRVDVAAACGADGVHLGAASIPPSVARRLLGPNALIGCSTHGEAELAAAAGDGADFATFGPVYATPSKAAYGPPVGVPALRRACRDSRIPVYALGGVVPGNVSEIASAGAAGIAVISSVLGATDPGAAAADLLARISHQGSSRDGGDGRAGDPQGKEGAP